MLTATRAGQQSIILGLIGTFRQIFMLPQLESLITHNTLLESALYEMLVPLSSSLAESPITSLTAADRQSLLTFCHELSGGILPYEQMLNHICMPILEAFLNGTVSQSSVSTEIITDNF